MKFKIHSYRSVSSTNRIAFQIAERGAEHGDVVVAEYQTEGRGRLGKSWESLKGLYFSIIIKPLGLITSDYSKITLTVGLAVAEAIDEIAGVHTHLKWPNDLYLNGKKCGGILTESSLTGDVSSHFVIVGVGINTHTEKDDFPLNLQEKATSLFQET